MQLQFLGASRTVTGSSYLLTVEKTKILIDCGMFQGSKKLEKSNYLPFPYLPSEIDFLLLTHAHIDHSGLIPKLIKFGFKGRIITTKASMDLCKVMLLDSAHIQEKETEWENRKNIRAGKKLKEPLYTTEDVEKSYIHFVPINYDNVVNLTDKVRCCFRDAGHILGSSSIELWIKKRTRETKIVFSGDIGTKDQAIVRDPTPIEDADYVLIESTYGDRLHKDKENTLAEFEKIINEAIESGGKVIIPSYAVARTQTLIYDLNELYNKKRIPSIPIFIDSPLAVESTEVYEKNTEYFDEFAQAILKRGDDPFAFPGLTYVRTVEESKKLNELEGPAIIISASGMCEAGRIRHHLKHNLWNRDNHIVFVGYQADETLGRRIIDGAKTVKILGETIAVKAKIHTLGGFSSHADQNGLIEWLGNFKKRKMKVFVVHGDEQKSLIFADKIREEFKHEVYVPEFGFVAEL